MQTENPDAIEANENPIDIALPATSHQKNQETEG